MLLNFLYDAGVTMPRNDPDGPETNPVFKIIVLGKTGKMAFETPGS